jgi:hypothetical protein
MTDVGSPPLLDIDAPQFQCDFGERPFIFHHRLATHPLLTLPRLVDLCRTLPAAQVEYNAGDLPISLDGASPANGLSADDTIRGIESHNSWMVLQNVERDPVYRRLLLDCIDQMRPHAERRRPGLRQPEAFIFVSSPTAVTPYHMDPEHGFLLQIHGTKTVTVFDGSRSDVVNDEALERFYCGTRHRHLALGAAAATYARAFVLAPGDAVHIPVTFPHHVEVGDAYSISLSVTFRTRDLYRRAGTYYWNAFLRRRGWSPTPYGRSYVRDSLKMRAAAALKRAQRLVRSR